VAGERLGYELGVIVAALLLAQAVLGHWDDDVNFVQGGFASSDVYKFGGKPCAERKHLVVFEQDDGAGHGRGVGAIAAREVKVVQAATANRAKRLRGCVHDDARNQWLPAFGA
jgi:hypothetical protein